MRRPSAKKLDTPTVRFAIEPAQADDPLDKCDTHSREAFRDLVKFLGLTLYVDFPDNPADCHSKDPQNMRPAKAEGPMSPLERVAALLRGNLSQVQTASAVGPDYLSYLNRKGDDGNISRQVLAAVYFFHVQSGACRAPIMFLTTAP